MYRRETGSVVGATRDTRKSPERILAPFLPAQRRVARTPPVQIRLCNAGGGGALTMANGLDPHDTTGERDYAENGQCTATNRNDNRCKNPATDNGVCRFHGGADGIGGQEGNLNALKHGLRARRGPLYDYMDDAQQEAVDRIEAALLDRYKDFHGREPDAADARDIYEHCVDNVARDFAREHMAKEGLESGNPLLERVEMEKDGKHIEFDKPNELIKPLLEMRREDRMQRKDKGLEKDPETEKADSVASMADAWRDGLSDPDDADTDADAGDATDST